MMSKKLIQTVARINRDELYLVQGYIVEGHPMTGKQFSNTKRRLERNLKVYKDLMQFADMEVRG